MTRAAVAIVVGAFALTSWAADDVAKPEPLTLRLYGLAEQFTWKERVDGQESIEEEGPILGVGAEVALRVSDTWSLEGRGEVFGGNVDYDGAIMLYTGDSIPYKSTTEYGGFKLEGNLAARLPLSDALYAKLYAGAGTRMWTRTLDKEADEDYIGRWGYEEDWLTVYAIVGCGGGLILNGRNELFARIEGRMTVANSMTADLGNVGGPSEVDLEPGSGTSLYAEGGINLIPFTLSIFVETLEFDESDMDDTYHAVFQPESTSTMVGCKIGLAL